MNVKFEEDTALFSKANYDNCFFKYTVLNDDVGGAGPQ